MSSFKKTTKQEEKIQRKLVRTDSLRSQQVFADAKKNIQPWSKS